MLCCDADIVILCWESNGDPPLDSGGGDCEGDVEAVNIHGEEDADSVGAGDAERLFDVNVDCGDSFLDPGNSFALRAWPMPLGVPDILTVALIVLWIAVLRCSMSAQGKVC